MIENIYRVYSLSTDWERESGLSYYRNQHNRLALLASRTGVSVPTAIGVFCALSPNNDEIGNYRDALTILSNRDHAFPVRVNTYGANKRKAERICLGEHPLHVLRGNKVRSFYLNTINPSDPFPVTVDGHIANIWAGERRNLVEVARGLTSRHYTSISDGLRTAASQIGILPCQLQSTIWLAWKRLHKIRYSPQLQLWNVEEVADWRSRIVVESPA